MEEEGERSQKKSRSNPPAAAAAASAAAVDSLIDDLKVEILSLLPPRYVHRFKCVSRSWRDLIAHPDHRKKLPQALAGFFYETCHWFLSPPFTRYFADVSGATHPPVDTSLSFLLPKFRDVDLLDTCAGLILCRCHCESHVYLVCNPATETWVELPENSRQLPENRRQMYTLRLAFDPAISLHFHVFAFEEIYITGVNIYSSETGAWNHRQSGWNHITLSLERSVFLNGMLHLITGQSVLAAVDTEGMLWRTIPLPHIWQYGSIGLSQGRLIFVNNIRASYGNISLWCLANYDSNEWVLKHTVNTKGLFEMAGQAYRVIAVHPDCDMIFLTTGEDTALASLDMEHVKFRHILNLEEGSTEAFLPYVPLFQNLEQMQMSTSFTWNDICGSSKNRSSAGWNILHLHDSS